jgi:hypothetical protein
MIKEHDRIVLTSDLSHESLKAGDVGTVVHVHDGGDAFEVEFMALDGTTVAVATVLKSQARPVSHEDVTHARPKVFVS